MDEARPAPAPLGWRGWLRRVAVVLGVVIIAAGALGTWASWSWGDDVAKATLARTKDGALFAALRSDRLEAGQIACVDLEVHRTGGDELDVEVTYALPSGERLRHRQKINSRGRGGGGRGSSLHRVARLEVRESGPVTAEVRVRPGPDIAVVALEATLVSDAFDHLEVSFLSVFLGMGLLFGAGAARRRNPAAPAQRTGGA